MTKASIEKSICFQYLQFSKKHLKICGGWVHVYMRMCFYICLCVCACICVFACVYLYVYMSVLVHVWECVYVCVCAYVVCICLCTCSRVYVCVHTWWASAFVQIPKCVCAHDVLLPLYLCQSVYRSEKPSEVASLLSWVSEIQVGSSDLLNDLADLQS